MRADILSHRFPFYSPCLPHLLPRLPNNFRMNHPCQASRRMDTVILHRRIFRSPVPRHLKVSRMISPPPLLLRAFRHRVILRQRTSPMSVLPRHRKVSRMISRPHPLLPRVYHRLSPTTVPPRHRKVSRMISPPPAPRLHQALTLNLIRPRPRLGNLSRRLHPRALLVRKPQTRVIPRIPPVLAFHLAPHSPARHRARYRTSVRITR